MRYIETLPPLTRILHGYLPQFDVFMRWNPWSERLEIEVGFCWTFSFITLDQEVPPWYPEGDCWPSLPPGRNYGN